MKTTRIFFACTAAVIACWFATPDTAKAQPSNSAYAVSLNGTNQQYIQIPAATWFNGNFTIEAWVYVRTFQNWSRLLDFANGPDNGNVYFSISAGTSGRLAAGVFTNSGVPTISSPGPMPINQWVHLAFTLSGTNGTLYVNETAVANGVLNTAPNVVRTNNYFGRSNYAPDGYADASFDEIRIWNSVRSVSDISTYKNSRFIGNEPGLVGYWRFDEGSGTVTSNAVASSTPGQLVNGPTWVVSPIATARTLPATLGPDGRFLLNATMCPAGLASGILFAWGTDPNNFSSVGGPVLVGSGLTYVNASFPISGLLPGTNYYFQILATNSFGNQYPPTAVFTTPQILTLPPSNITTNSVKFIGSVLNNNPAISAWFEWGSTTNYGTKTSVTAIPSSGVQSFQQTISGLSPGTAGHYRAVCSNNIAGILYGNDVVFAASSFAMVTNLPVNFGSFPFPGFGAFAAWGDFNNDGLLDLLYIGPVPAALFSTTSKPYLFQNVTNGFLDVTANSPALTNNYTYAAWLDFDNDGRLDLLLSTANLTRLWHNTGSNFVDVTTAVAPALANVTAIGAVPWDYDNDGRVDLLLPGASSQIWRNTPNGFINVTASVAPGLSSFASSWAAWGDFDGDGFADFIIGGSSGTQLWRNTGNAFTNVTASMAPGFSNVVASAAACGDMNNDGLLDIVFASPDPGIPQLWMNTGNSFTNAIALLPSSAILGSPVTLGDFDNDGFLDILGGGSSLVQNSGAIWRNTGTNFIDVTAQVAPGLPSVGPTPILAGVGNVSWGDFDNDGRLDLLIAGGVAASGAGQTVGQIWKNVAAQTNTPPSAPTGLSATVSNQIITFHWNSATDATTPGAALTYNFALGTTPGGSDVINPLASASGRLRLPQIGNRQYARTLNLTALAINKPYYWSVQSVDSGFAGSTFNSGSFTLGGLLLPPGGALIPGDMNGDGVVTPDELANVLNNLNGPVSPTSVQQVLSNFLAQAPLYMTNTLGLGNTNVTFALTNSPTNLFSVEYSTNLTEWQLLGPASLRYGFTDTNATTGSPRYYRLRLP